MADGIQRLFSALYANVDPDLRVALWDKDTRRSVHVKVSDVTTVEAYAAEKVSERRDAYFSVCPHKEDLGPHSHGAAADKVCIPALWTDIDGRWGVHADQNTPPDEDAVAEILSSVPLPPSIAVRTGGGIHAYWILDKPLPTSSALPKRLGSALRAAAARLGYTGVDRVHALSQVLRLPDTFNFKDPNGPRPVTLV